MLRNKGLRFPQRKFVRHMGVMKQELREWRDHYRTVAPPNDTMSIVAHLLERSEALDEAWHQLDEAQRTIAWMR